MAKILQRDEHALAALIDRYGGQVLAVCLRICSDPVEANGAITDVFSHLWHQADSFEPRRGSLRSYLLTLARSRSIDARRSAVLDSSQRTRPIDVAMNSGPIQTAVTGLVTRLPSDEDENAQEVQQSLGQLSDQQRSVLHLAFFDGLSHQEVATLLQTPLATVKAHIRMGLQILNQS